MGGQLYSLPAGQHTQFARQCEKSQNLKTNFALVGIFEAITLWLIVEHTNHFACQQAPGGLGTHPNGGSQTIVILSRLLY